MSIKSASDRASQSTPDPVVRLAFVGNVHKLIALGYSRMDRQGYRDSGENLLNQDFVAALRAVTQDGPAWACHFAIHEKQKQNDGVLEGNDRFELDFCLERTQRGPHPSFIIEAKRLGTSHPLSTYLGPEGLGAYISCEYAKDHCDAGMLGYVQSKTVAAWCNLLATELGVSPGNSAVHQSGKWKLNTFRDGPGNTYRTRHNRKLQRPPITVFHTLLDFT